MRKVSNNGKEVFFFYNEGHFIIQLENTEEEYNSNKGVYLLYVRNLVTLKFEFRFFTQRRQDAKYFLCTFAPLR